MESSFTHFCLKLYDNCCISVLYEPDWQQNLKVLFPSVVCSSKRYLEMWSFDFVLRLYSFFYPLTVMVLMVLVPLSTACLKVIYFSAFCLFFVCLASHTAPTVTLPVLLTCLFFLNAIFIWLSVNYLFIIRLIITFFELDKAYTSHFFQLCDWIIINSTALLNTNTSSLSYPITVFPLQLSWEPVHVGNYICGWWILGINVYTFIWYM